MATLIICVDGSSFIICSLAIVASILCFSAQLCRAVKVAEEHIAPCTNTQPPEKDINSHGTTEDSTPPAQTTQDPWNDSTKEAPVPARKRSFSMSVPTIGKRLSMPRSKSLSFLWRSHRKSSLDDTPPLPPLLGTDSASTAVAPLAEPFTAEDKDDPEWAEPPVFTPDSSATMIETPSAAADDDMQVSQDVTEPPNTQMSLARTALAAPAAAPAPMSTTSSSSSSSTSPDPRVRTTPKGPRPRPASMSALGVDGRRRYARPACPENSLPGEIFETRFENPFKPRSRSLTVKREKADSKDDTPKRHSIFDIFSTLRRSLAKHKLAVGDSEASASPASESPPPSSSNSSRRTSVSSATGTTLSVGSGSGSTKAKWLGCVRNGVPRTDPYGFPHFAQMPVQSPNSEGRQARRRSRRA